MLPFEIWSANIQYDDKNNKKERPIIILGLQDDRIICLKCTTNINTNIPHQGINWKKYNLLKPTVVEFKRKYFIKKSNIKYKLSKLDTYDILNILSKLRINELKDFYLEALEEAKKSKKKRKNQTQNNPVFKSVDDLKKWVKKRQKGLSPFSYLNPNAGNVEYNNDMFNHMTGADGGDFGSLSGSGNELGAPAIGSDMGSFGGDAGASGGMGESFKIEEKNKHKSNHKQNNSLGELIWYKLPSGRMPAKEFYENSSDRIQASFERYFKALKDNSLNIFKEASKVLDSKEKIFELRVKDSDHWARITYTKLNNNSILLLGFNKDQNQTPKIEIEKSIKYKKEFINSRRGDIVNVGQS